MGASIQSIALGKSLCIGFIFVSHQSLEKLFEEKTYHTVLTGIYDRFGLKMNLEFIPRFLEKIEILKIFKNRLSYGPDVRQKCSCIHGL